MFGPTVSTTWLNEHLADQELVLVDVRWYIDRKGGGRAAYEMGRIPGAIFLDLDEDLSDRSDLTRGRHPLPNPQDFVEKLARNGIGQESKVIAYDDSGGSIAARLWWMMRWIGSKQAAILDGGIPRWIHDGFTLESGIPHRIKSVKQSLAPLTTSELIADLPTVEVHDPRTTFLIDARAPERFLGEVEPIDFRAGHIPGAINFPYAGNLTEEAAPVFRSPEKLRLHFQQQGITPESDVICYCGSGVTACHNIIALELAGLAKARLYPGSWSEWIQHHC